ncbi:hypothetical protein CVT26_001389 [Gymnopilus dilepis]|uniref:HMG domain-containing protein n=1 Tax=Gymnopilus dilepis TaxID=231916 RepID=A0A409WYP1_9AGAR|nr:hypothetical protein CVT26_001389 [Gymnopilus dilepis]
MAESLVSFDEPPPSPTVAISWDLADFSPGLEIISPKRKQRVERGRSKKRQKKRLPSESPVRKSSESKNKHSEKVTRSLSDNVTNSAINESDGHIDQLSQCYLDDLSPDVPCPTEGQYQRADILEATKTKPAYASFKEAVFTEELDFWQISRTLFIVNGWDRQQNTATSTYYHLQMTLNGKKKNCHCVCPEKNSDKCLHIKFLEDHGDDRFPVDERLIDEDDQCILFSRNVEQYDPLIYRNMFSAPTSSRFGSVKNRAVVQHLGPDTGLGTWTCSKHPKELTCEHIMSSRAILLRRVRPDTSTQTDLPNDNGSSGPGTDTFVRHVMDDLPAVSYKPIPPPVWSRISSDSKDLPIVPTVKEPPSLIALTASASCSCSSQSRRHMYRPTAEKRVQKCEVYGLVRMWQVEIEVQKCPSCRHRWIGSDCQDIGLFNWNNRILVTHDLLDDYTSSFVSSETPFVAWTAVTSRRYQRSESPSSFLSEKKFRAIWFAYARLLQLDNDMHCVRCGPNPRVTIWDGVTLAFSKKNLTASLTPPSKVHPKAKIRERPHAPPSTQCIQDRSLRGKIRFVLSGPALRLMVEDDAASDIVSGEDNPSDDDSAENAAAKKAERALLRRRKAADHMASRIEQTQEVIDGLNGIDPSLGSLFRRCYGRDALISGRIIPPAYRNLFMQLAAEESVLQLVTRPLVDKLKIFVRNPNLDNASHLTMVPALYNVVMLELNSKDMRQVSYDVIGISQWVMARALAVFLSLKNYEGGELDAKGMVPPDNWQKARSLYSMPQIRYRPDYRRMIPTDGSRDLGGQAKRGTGCGKHFSEYGQKRLTGGIMAVWCTHSVCYGFHCIPASEGRNEVFSAIYTHWEKAPEIIIYDYACNLAPYVMAREPKFFANTKCLVDHFHSAGHTACGDACKLMTYVSANPDLDKINSSAAESGNSGIRRIRKSVSYMTQEHAIIYTKTFLSIRNRLIIRKYEMECSR